MGNETKKPPTISLELLRELELQANLGPDEESLDELSAEQELNFEDQYSQREYEPELWDALEDDDDSSSDEDKST